MTRLGEKQAYENLYGSPFSLEISVVISLKGYKSAYMFCPNNFLPPQGNVSFLMPRIFITKSIIKIQGEMNKNVYSHGK